ncbi:hypothetical protein LG296_19710 (plasmid) [Ureibacillus chungkukjangi]|uniref:hypothetical protein n=1 Tax=Ureibacillus chungkukjangi TaxID=1202712 RepID=UPI000D3A25E1|nr:hypothetical protein [Ureibacillus chungkukjangi]MCM3390542.1 hypothetical protein [Ureibacillus chungkukjangi]
MTNLNNPYDLFSLVDDEIVNTTEPTNVEDNETVQTDNVVSNEVDNTVNTTANLVEPVTDISNESLLPAVIESVNTVDSPVVTETNIANVMELPEVIESDCSNDSGQQSITEDCITSTEDGNVEPSSQPQENALSLIEQLSQKGDEAESEKEVAKQEKSSSLTKTPKNTFDVNESTIVRYYRELIPLTNYFTTEEIVEGVRLTKKDKTVELKKIDGEMVRQRLEKDFPEFVKGHTEMVYHGGNRNFIIPAVVAKRKGNLEESVQEEVLSSNDDTSFSFPTKIPFRLLNQFIALAKAFGELKLEVRADIVRP